VIHLDTNVAIALLNHRQPKVRDRFDAARAAGTPLGLSMIVYHELMYGAAANDASVMPSRRERRGFLDRDQAPRTRGVQC
jgi:predicted nucleic acid-binding protein